MCPTGAANGRHDRVAAGGAAGGADLSVVASGFLRLMGAWWMVHRGCGLF